MKLILIILMFSTSAIAGNFVKKSAIKNPSKIWVKKSKCEAQEGEKCFDISGKDIRRFKMGLVDNLESPKYLKKDQAACTDFDSCNPLMQALDCSVYAEGSYAMIAEDFSEVYCAEPNGYNKKDDLVVDSAGATQADADDAAKAAKKLDKKKRKDQCDVDSDSPTMTLKQLSDCVKVLMGK